jgi:hypothetical protein
MSSEHISDELTAYLSGELDEESVRRVESHIELCASCREEHRSMRLLWDKLGRLPEEAPGASMRVRFREMMRTYKRAVETAGPRTRVRLLERLIPWRPAIGLAFGLAAVAGGMLLGYHMKTDRDGGAELSQLHEEVRGVSRLLIISLLQQESASERLRGVSWSYQTDASDAGITAALLDALRHDPNVNVRLAALDALARSMNRSDVREDLLRSLPKQPSPLVQAAIVDLMVQLHERSSLGVFREMVRDTALNSSVKKKIEQGIQQLI